LRFNLPAVGVKGVSHVKGRGSQNPKAAALHHECKGGPADACTFDTLISVQGMGSKILFELSTVQGRERALPPMTAATLNPLPARSNGLDNVDGGPDAAFYIQIGIV
jgi:hypothetical protein